MTTQDEETPETRIAPGGRAYQLAPGQDPEHEVVTLVGANGEPGLAIPGEEWKSWPIQ
jgi:hypothetical protein